jgi:hypothetical protein
VRYRRVALNGPEDVQRQDEAPASRLDATVSDMVRSGRSGRFGTVCVVSVDLPMLEECAVEIEIAGVS